MTTNGAEPTIYYKLKKPYKGVTYSGYFFKRQGGEVMELVAILPFSGEVIFPLPDGEVDLDYFEVFDELKEHERNEIKEIVNNHIVNQNSFIDQHGHNLLPLMIDKILEWYRKPRG